MLRHARYPVVVLVVSCTTLDPGAFGPKGSPGDEPEAAGFAFDAGLAPALGGRAGSASMSRAEDGGRSNAGRSADPDGGEGGAPDDGGDPPAGGSGGTVGGVAGLGGVRSASGGAGARGGFGGSRPSGGGSGGRASGGVGASSGRAATAGSGQGGVRATHALYFSEYVEGSSSYKALELTAREASTLAGCRLVTYFNGASAGSNITLDGSLEAGGRYVLCSSLLATLVGAACDRATNLTFNGDDAVALECDGALLDVIGQVGVDPGDAWGSGDASTLNHTLRRSCRASAGDRDGSDPFDPAAEWTALGVDTFDGLGLAECEGS
jgi:hypothetical protein